MNGQSPIRFIAIAVLAPILLAAAPVLSDTPKIKIASKTFTESVVLGEIMAGLIEKIKGDKE